MNNLDGVKCPNWLPTTLSITARFNGGYTLLCVWCGLKAITFSLARTLFLFFLSVGNQLVINKMKNILKIYLQKFADMKYLRIFVV